MILSYLGSKASVMKQLHQVIDPLIQKCSELKQHTPIVFADLFSGTGVVAAEFMSHPLVGNVITNDLELYSYVLNKAVLQVPITGKLVKIISYFNSHLVKGVAGIITKQYSPYKGCPRMFFTVENAKKIDAIRIAIHTMYSKSLITYNEFLFLLGSLFASVSKYANCTSCFRAYLKTFSSRSKRKFSFAPVHTRSVGHQQFSSQKVTRIYNGDIMLNVNKMQDIDIVYLDPPYSSNHYGSYYGFYNVLGIYRNDFHIGGVAGVPLVYNKSLFGMKSTCQTAFRTLLRALTKRTKYVVMSYNDNGVMTKKCLIDLLREFGSVSCYKLWNKKYRPNSNVIDMMVKDFIIVIDFNGFKGEVKEAWLL